MKPFLVVPESPTAALLHILPAAFLSSCLTILALHLLTNSPPLPSLLNESGWSEHRGNWCWHQMTQLGACGSPSFQKLDCPELEGSNLPSLMKHNRNINETEGLLCSTKIPTHGFQTGNCCKLDIIQVQIELFVSLGSPLNVPPISLNCHQPAMNAKKSRGKAC